MATTKEREQFLIVLASQITDKPVGEVWRLGRLLLRHAKTHGRLQEISCSVEMSDYQEKRHEAQEARVEKRIVQLAHELGIRTVKFGGDPRGYTVKLILPAGTWNTWGGKEEGYGVPQ